MNFLESMQMRYTTKKYDATKKVDPSKIQELKEILQLSPSSINSQPWQFAFISDEDVRKRLSNVSWHNTEKILECDTIIVFSRIENIALFEQQIENELPERAVNYYKTFIKPMSDDQIKSWFGRQVYLALGVFLSACAQMEIDATPMEGIEPDRYDEILGQTDYATIVAVAIGRRDFEDFNQPHKKPKSRRAFEKVIKTV